jgi:hypothetical protein
VKVLASGQLIDWAASEFCSNRSHLPFDSTSFHSFVLLNAWRCQALNWWFIAWLVRRFPTNVLDQEHTFRGSLANATSLLNTARKSLNLLNYFVHFSRHTHDIQPPVCGQTDSWIFIWGFWCGIANVTKIGHWSASQTSVSWHLVVTRQWASRGVSGSVSSEWDPSNFHTKNEYPKHQLQDHDEQHQDEQHHGEQHADAVPTVSEVTVSKNNSEQKAVRPQPAYTRRWCPRTTSITNQLHQLSELHHS